MRKIALIMDGWKRYFTYAWPSGILQRIHETREDVNLYIFNSSGNWSRDGEYNAGEYNIFRLPDLKEFDGIILDLNNIEEKSVRSEVIALAKAAGVPVLSISDAVEGFYYVGINNYDAMKRMITHLHEQHGCRRFWFIMGPEDNYENRRRTQALRDFLIENNLPCTEDIFFFESFDYQCGVHGFEHMWMRFGEKPDAIICVNDNVAVGVCEMAAAHGFRVPEDFCVTGFDNFDKASYYEPHITTVGHIREDVGYLCADILIRLWAGEEVPRFNYTGTECIFWESCGCGGGMEINARQHLKGQIMYGIETTGFDEAVLYLKYELMRCNSVREMMNCIPQCIPSLKCDAMYLVLDDYIDAYRKQDTSMGIQMPEDGGLCIEGYPERMRVRFAYEDGKCVDIKDMEISNIFPLFDYAEGGRDFLFLPIHFRNLTIGYLVIRNAVYLMEKQYLFQVLNALTTAMENLYKNEKLEYMNQVLSRLYIMDAMTGMYNRLGYQQLAQKYFVKKHRKNKSVMILFIDLDRLKTINDNLGHKCGDFAIISTAKAILKYCDRDAVPARTGGDEFVLVQDASDRETQDGLMRNIREELSRIREAEKFPYELSVSIGLSVSDPSSSRKFEDYVKEADEMMYREKIRKKVNR